MLAHTCAHACIVAHMDLDIIIMAYSHTLKYTVHLHIPDGYTCMWHTINLSGNDGAHTHKHGDMHMHSIPFIKLLLCMFVQAIDLMYRRSMYCCTYPWYKYSYSLCMLSSHV